MSERATIGLMILEPVSRIAAQHDYDPPWGMRFEGSPDVLDPITEGLPALDPACQRTMFGIPVHQVYPLKPGAWQVIDPAGRVLARGVAAPDHMAVVGRHRWDNATITVDYRTPAPVVSDALADELGQDAMPEVGRMIRDAYTRMLPPPWAVGIPRIEPYWEPKPHVVKVTDIY